MQNSDNDQDGKSALTDSAANFSLDTFFPYHVRVYYRAVSQSVTKVYESMFGLTVSEWRTMAVLGSHQSLSPSDIVERSSIDKVNVSRAIKGLQERGYLDRRVDPVDGRRAQLTLSDEGRSAFETLVPKVRELEKQLLSGLSEDDQDRLMAMMAQVRTNAENLS